MIRWFSRHQERVEERLGLGDADRSESIRPEDFELGNPSPLYTLIPSLGQLWEISLLRVFSLWWKQLWSLVGLVYLCAKIYGSSN